MLLSLFAGIAVAAFVLQLTLCIRAQRTWVKLTLAGLILIIDAVCWIAYFLDLFPEIYGAAFASFIYGIILLFVLAAVLLAWMIYGIVKLIQKRRK